MDSSVNKPKKDQAVLQLLRPLSKYLDAPEVTEVTINRPAEVWTKTFKGWEAYQVDELNASYLQALANAIVVFNGVQPKSIVSVVLPGGQRGQIVMPPACIDGTLSLSIRKHSMVVKTLDELIAKARAERKKK